MMANKILGIHTEIMAGHPALMANEAETVWKKMYEKLSANPNPMEAPIPPFRFSHESETPISVNMNAAKGMAKRL